MKRLHTTNFLKTLSLTKLYHKYVTYNFRTISKGKVYKSGVINPDKIVDFLTEHNIKSVIDLRLPGTSDLKNNPEITTEVNAEKLALEKTDTITYFYNGTKQIPKKKQLKSFFKIMDNPNNYPVLIHCHHGVGRAKLFSALYRIEYEGWSNTKARKHTRFITKWSSFAIGKGKGDFLNNYIKRTDKQPTVIKLKVKKKRPFKVAT